MKKKKTDVKCGMEKQRGYLAQEDMLYTAEESLGDCGRSFDDFAEYGLDAKVIEDFFRGEIIITLELFFEIQRIFHEFGYQFYFTETCHVPKTDATRRDVLRYLCSEAGVSKKKTQEYLEIMPYSAVMRLLDKSENKARLWSINQKEKRDQELNKNE